MKYNVRSPSMILSSKLKPSIPGQHLVQDSRPIDRPFVKSLFDLASSAFYTRETRTHEEAFLTASLARSSRIERTRECRNASDVTSRRALPVPERRCSIRVISLPMWNTSFAPRSRQSATGRPIVPPRNRVERPLRALRGNIFSKFSLSLSLT